MNHPHLPDDFEASAIEADLIIQILHEEIGIPMKELKEVGLQGLYDLVLKHASPKKHKAYQDLVVIDRETAEELRRHNLRTLPGLRSDRKNISLEVKLMARCEALIRLPFLAKDASLQVIDEALRASGRKNYLSVEDRDYDRFGIEMNRIISRHPHGRSRAIVTEALPPSDVALNEPVAETYVAALAALMLARSGPIPSTNARAVGFAWTEVGTEGQLANAEMTTDLVILAFEPGRESEGPVNIAVLEEHDGKPIFWPRCSPWCMPDGSLFMVVSNDDSQGFLFAPPFLAPVQRVPKQDFADRIEIAQRVLRQTASHTEI